MVSGFRPVTPLKIRIGKFYFLVGGINFLKILTFPKVLTDPVLTRNDPFRKCFVFLKVAFVVDNEPFCIKNNRRGTVRDFDLIAFFRVFIEKFYDSLVRPVIIMGYLPGIIKKRGFYFGIIK